MDDGPEAIGDEAELNAVRRQAARVRRRALLATAALTGLALLLPL
jgi:hypothetical protein